MGGDRGGVDPVRIWIQGPGRLEHVVGTSRLDFEMPLLIRTRFGGDSKPLLVHIVLAFDEIGMAPFGHDAVVS